MRNMNVLDWIAAILVIIGALNWGLIGFFNYDLIAAIFGNMSIVTRIIYSIIGLAGIYMIYCLVKCCKECKEPHIHT